MCALHMEYAGLSKEYWGEAVMTVKFLRNRCPTRADNHNKATHQVWTSKMPLLAAWFSRMFHGAKGKAC